MDTSNDEGNVVNVEVRFRTSMNKYKVTDKSFQIPVTLNRRGLSQVINHLLGTSMYNIYYIIYSYYVYEFLILII